MTHVEFLRWEKELEEELNEREAADWQVASVAYEVYLLRHVVAHLFSKTVPKPAMELKDFLVKFKVPEQDAPKRNLKQVRKLAMARSSGAAALITTLFGAGSKE